MQPVLHAGNGRLDGLGVGASWQAGDIVGPVVWGNEPTRVSLGLGAAAIGAQFGGVAADLGRLGAPLALALAGALASSTTWSASERVSSWALHLTHGLGVSRCGVISLAWSADRLIRAWGHGRWPVSVQDWLGA